MQISTERHRAKNGENTLKINEYFIHSKYNPMREATQIVEKNYCPHHAHVFFGYGCGYLVQALLKVRQFNETIIVVDPLFDGVIEKPKSKANVFYFESKILNDFEFYLSDLTAQVRISYKVVCLSNYDKIFPNEYKLLLSKVKDFQNRNLVNDYTILKYSEVWHSNFLENMIHLEKDNSATVLKKVYKEAVVIVSGGPSLAKQIPLLKKYRNKLILVCAGSTINSLIAEEIEPDYVATIDGGDPNYQHFKGIKLKDARIVYTMQSHPLVRESFEKLGYVVATNGSAMSERYLKEELKIEIPTFIGGASVAHVAFNFAKFITTGPVALIGQDLAYTDNLTHANTNKFARNIDEQFIKEKQAFKITSYYGENIWTSPALNSMRLEFEDIIKFDPPENLLFNCTEGGAKINGYTHMSFKDFCEIYASKEEIKILNHDEINNHYNVSQSFQKELDLYNQLLEMLNNAIKILKNNKGSNQFDINTMKKLQKLEKKIQNIINKLTIEPLISPVVMHTLRNYLPKINETEKEAYLRTFAQMEDMYHSLREKTDVAKKVLKEIIEKREKNE